MDIYTAIIFTFWNMSECISRTEMKIKVAIQQQQQDLSMCFWTEMKGICPYIAGTIDHVTHMFLHADSYETKVNNVK